MKTQGSSQFAATHTTWNIMVSGERYAQKVFGVRFSKEHVEACAKQEFNLKTLFAEKA